MTKIATIEDAICVAAQAHRGQQDKAGAPYLLHPLRMMLRMDSETAMMAAALHDVVEDTDWTLKRLREAGFAEEVVEDRKSTRLNSSHANISYAVFCLKKKTYRESDLTVNDE